MSATEKKKKTAVNGTIFRMRLTAPGEGLVMEEGAEGTAGRVTLKSEGRYWRAAYWVREAQSPPPVTRIQYVSPSVAVSCSAENMASYRSPAGEETG